MKSLLMLLIAPLAFAQESLDEFDLGSFEAAVQQRWIERTTYDPAKEVGEVGKRTLVIYATGKVTSGAFNSYAEAAKDLRSELNRLDRLSKAYFRAIVRGPLKWVVPESDGMDDGYSKLLRKDGKGEVRGEAYTVYVNELESINHDDIEAVNVVIRSFTKIEPGEDPTKVKPLFRWEIRFKTPAKIKQRKTLLVTASTGGGYAKDFFIDPNLFVIPHKKSSKDPVKNVSMEEWLEWDLAPKQTEYFLKDKSQHLRVRWFSEY